MHKEDRNEQGRENTHDVNVENPNVGKTTAAHRLEKITMREEYNDGESTEATTSCTPSSPHGGYNEATTSSSLSLSHTHTHTHSRYTVTHYTTNTTTINTLVFDLSHIYTHMTFGLFTHMAPRGSQEHIYICVPSNRSGGLPPGLRSSGSP